MNRFSTATSRRLLTSLTIATAAAVLPAHAKDIYCKPSFFIDNDTPISIKVLKVAYKTDEGWFEEGLDNRKLAKHPGPDSADTWKTQKLGKLAEGLALTKVSVQYKSDNSGAGDGYGKAGWSKPTTHTGTCQDSDTFHHVIAAGDAHKDSYKDFE